MSVSATTVAERGARCRRAISPKHSPGPNVPRLRPSIVAFALPASITKNQTKIARRIRTRPAGTSTRR